MLPLDIEQKGLSARREGDMCAGLARGRRVFTSKRLLVHLIG
jgi:hypothetical protein